MKNPLSIQDIDLHPKPGKQYWQSGRSWRDEIIYFLLVDRFHDDHERSPVTSAGFGKIEELQRSCGGTLKGIQNHLEYIKNLGCTAIWLSPVFENNPQSYHGYDICNFLNIDPRFGTKEDLENLITEAHEKGIKIFLDVVINHSGNNWFYLGNKEYNYSKGARYKFGGWRSNHFPIPVELRNPEYYLRKGCVTRWDDYPETREGDFFSLKKFNHEETQAGLDLQEILLKIYCYWIREVDCDGFRMDAAKHIGEIPVARFSTKVKEYAKTLGKEEFFIFGEIASDDTFASKFLKPVYSEKEKRDYQAIDSLLDFPLHFSLSKIIQGSYSFSKLRERYISVEKNFDLKKRQGFQLVNFLDNHDQIEKPYKKRIAAQLNEEQLMAALAVLFCLPGIPCLYYGTEQGFKGEGESDGSIRECMFDLTNDTFNGLNEESKIYKELRKIIHLRKETPALKSGKIMFPDLLSDGTSTLLKKESGVCFFIRSLEDQEIMIGYNPSINESRTIYVQLERLTDKLSFIYGRTGTIALEQKKTGPKSTCFLQLELNPMEFIILK